ncbi:hypothetical protein ACMATS_16940 [Streptoverticillium reticulum]|uniref:hypothetical protein n=1 Tax=Streptoverticillium reticulum TaxID=1433415 RepID=UPI0039BFA551
MPRGRHRHSAPLHRLLPASTVAATSVACAAGAWLVEETLLIRSLAVAASAAAVVGAVLMRRWDRSAGKRVAQLTAARARDEWKTDERIAELETDLEEAGLAKARVEAKLRTKRAELARLRTEHADLLRRYATAETGRASALEGRRLLARAKTANELEPATADRPGAEEARPGAEVFRKAADALRNLERNAARQQAAAARSPEPVTGPESAPEPESASEPAPKSEAKPAPKAEAKKPEADAAGEPEAPSEAAAKSEAHAPSGAKPAAGPSTALVPQTPARRPASRAQGGFDFFGTGRVPAASSKPVEEQDLADVVGEEALAEAEAEAGADADAKVIDLTAHDETEQIDVAELRSAIS